MEKQVRAGIAFLDRWYGPRWPNLVDTESIDINNTELCVLGQVAGSKGEGFYEIVDLACPDIGSAPAWEVDHGFQVETGEDSADLAEVWARHILRLREV